MHRYAIIGFGSLLWDLETLGPQVVGPWEYYTGPILPLEFSLVSEKRNRALALDIDLEHGTPCPTCIIKSRRNTVAEAVIDLAARELRVDSRTNPELGRIKPMGRRSLDRRRKQLSDCNWN